MTKAQPYFCALVCFLCPLFLAPPTYAQAPPEELTLKVGQQITLPAVGIRNYSIGTQGIIRVRVTSDGKSFLVVGQEAGETTLLLIRQDGQQIQYKITVAGKEGPVTDKERENIRLDFYFVSLVESYAHQLGIGWPGTLAFAGGNFVTNFKAIGNSGVDFLSEATGFITIGGIPGAGGQNGAQGGQGGGAAASAQSLLRLDLMQASGWARVLRHATVITANGSQATFSSGGEVNVAVSGGIGGQLQQISFGSNIQVLPVYNVDTGRIDLTINAQVSDLADDRGTGIPGRSTANLNTSVNVEMGQAIALAGLISDSTSSGMRGLPGLSQIPILGLLFGSTNRNRQSLQNILLIVPTVVEMVPQSVRRLIAESLAIYWDYSGGLDSIQLMPSAAGIPTGAHPDSRSQSR